MRDGSFYDPPTYDPRYEYEQVGTIDFEGEAYITLTDPATNKPVELYAEITGTEYIQPNSWEKYAITIWVMDADQPLVKRVEWNEVPEWLIPARDAANKAIKRGEFQEDYE